MTKCIFCNRDCITPPGATDIWLIKTYSYCDNCDELIPNNEVKDGN